MASDLFTVRKLSHLTWGLLLCLLYSPLYSSPKTLPAWWQQFSVKEGAAAAQGQDTRFLASCCHLWGMYTLDMLLTSLEVSLWLTGVYFPGYWENLIICNVSELLSTEWMKRTAWNDKEWVKIDRTIIKAFWMIWTEKEMITVRRKQLFSGTS